jgi:UDP-N-acetylglucosamine acyltransferase
MAYTHVAHDCFIGNNNVFANNAGLAGHVIIGDFVVMGGYSAVHQFCRLGDHSFVGMNTSITMDIPAFLKAASNPARILGLNSVGMTRNEISNDSISILKKAFKLVYKKQLKLDEAIKELEIMLSETNSIHLETFIKSIQTSSRGILR